MVSEWPQKLGAASCCLVPKGSTQKKGDDEDHGLDDSSTYCQYPCDDSGYEQCERKWASGKKPYASLSPRTRSRDSLQKMMSATNVKKLGCRSGHGAAQSGRNASASGTA